MQSKFKLPEVDICQQESMLQDPKEVEKTDLFHWHKVYKAKINGIVQLTEMEKLFQLSIIDPRERENFVFRPGQFLMLDVPGVGEIPLSITSSAQMRGALELCVRKAGKVTNFLHGVKRGFVVGIRGPFGSFFPMEKMKGSNVLLIAGGLGLAPLRSVIYHVKENRTDYKDVTIFYGAKEPNQLLFTYQYEEWQKIDDVEMKVIVEKPDQDWKDPVGLITKLFEGAKIDPDRTWAIVCGPPVMFKFVCAELHKIGIPNNKMFVDLERRMHCGMGKCCRCNVASTYVCLSGPVFDYWTVMNLREAI